MQAQAVQKCVLNCQALQCVSNIPDAPRPMAYIVQQHMPRSPKQGLGDMKRPLLEEVSDAIVSVFRSFSEISGVVSVGAQRDFEASAPKVAGMREASSAVNGVPEDWCKHSEDHFRH